MLQLCYFGFVLGCVAYAFALAHMGTIAAQISVEFGHGSMLTTICLLLFWRVHRKQDQPTNQELAQAIKRLAAEVHTLEIPQAGQRAEPGIDERIRKP